MKRSSHVHPAIPALVIALSLLTVFAEHLPAQFQSVLHNHSSLSSPIAHPKQTAAPHRAPRRLENFDLRADRQILSRIRPGLQLRRYSSHAAPPGLLRAHPDARLRAALSGAPALVYSAAEALSAPTQGKPETIARAFLAANADLYRLNEQDVAALRVAQQDSSAIGLTHLTLQQSINGIDVFQARLTTHLDRHGAVIATTGELMPDAATSINLKKPVLTVNAALALAAGFAGTEPGQASLSATPVSGPEQLQTIEQPAEFARGVNARLVFFPLAADELRLAWEFEIWPQGAADAYLIVVDAARGSLLYRYNLTCDEGNPLQPHGLIYAGDSPRPGNPYTTDHPAIAERQDRPFRAEPFNGAAIFAPGDQHADWWAGAAADSLVSNNTDAHADRDGNNQADLPLLKAPDGNFSFPVDFTQPPYQEASQKAALVNLFYWVNRYHDILYSFGFTESAGNFQTRNFGLGGVEGDAIQADAQDGSGTNNANFSTPPDGRPGRVQMFLWSGSPQPDGDFDQTVILHELTHGLSNRLIGNGTGLSGFQSRAMGEGWSDYFALALLRQESDPLDGAYAIGQYVRNNYAQGIRRYPYSTSRAVYPLTFAALSLSPSVHAAGEIWCVALWDMRARLIGQYGFTEGQRLSLQLVVDGLKLTPPEPDFLEAREAILLADRAVNRGANQRLLWQAFASRGLGFSADTAGAADNAPVEAFDLPPWCSDTASLQLDKQNYVSGELIHLTLNDYNASSPKLQLSSSATGDHETLTAIADPAVPGRFTASLRLAAGRSSSGDGVLQAAVETGDQIIVTYDDAITASGNPATVIATAGLVREKTVFADDVEHGNQGWIASGAWAITARRAASGTRAWTDSPAGNYASNSDSSIISPLVDLTGLSGATLSFAQSFDLEYRYDYGLVEYSIDEGATWTKAAAFTGQQSEFRQAQLSLPALAGQRRARIRFRLLTDQAGTADGWYIDNIRLTARSASPAVIKPGSETAPQINAISPAFSAPAGGQLVTITGSGFTDAADSMLTFDGLPAQQLNVTGSTTMTAIVPPHNAGAVLVRLVNRHGGAAFSNGFLYYQPGSATPAPQAERIFPASGSLRGGSVVTITGDNFNPETRVSFGSSIAAVSFINSGTLRVIAPAAAASGAVDVTISNGAQHTTLPGAFTYTAPTPPTVSFISPVSGDELFTGSTVSIRWQSADDSAIARHRLKLVPGAGGATTPPSDIASELPGNAQSFNWTVPAADNLSRARLCVIATDDAGSETEACSGEFTLARRWEAAKQLPFPLQRLQAASDDRHIFIFGGRTSSLSSATIETVSRFDPLSNTWTNDVAPMPAGLSNGAAVFLDGRIYLPGGITSSSAAPTQQHFVYDVAGNAWSQAAQVPAAGYFYALAADAARHAFYLTGGLNNLGGAVATARAYQPQSDQWSELPPMLTARYGHTSAVINGRLFVAGGFGLTGGLSSAEVFDFTTEKWSAIASLSRARRFAVSATGADVAGHPVWLICGGEDPITGQPIPTVEAYDVQRNQWFTLDSSFNQPVPRSQLAAATVNGNLYTIGGAAFQGSFVTLTTVTTVERMKISGFNPVSAAAPPVLAVPDTQIAIAGQPVSFSLTASDFNSQAPLSITAQGLPESATFTTTAATNNQARGEFKWTPGPDDTGRTVQLTFTARDESLSDSRTVIIKVVAASPLAVVNAANYRAGVIAPDSIVAAFGTNLAARTETAQALPLPLTLAGTSVTVNGLSAPLFFVSPKQINFAVPPGIATDAAGTAQIIVSSPLGTFALGTVNIAQTDAAIFTADAGGQGEAAALATVDGITYQSSPFAVLVNGAPNILVLYGTGLRHASAVSVSIGGQAARVLYAGAQGSFVGLDQLNVEIPRGLASAVNHAPQRTEIIVTVNGAEASRVYVLLR